jgi:cytosine/adenosine deaminase-related metal-dependent hydrolase
MSETSATAPPSDAETRERLERSSGDPTRRILVVGGTVVTMDPAVDDLLRGDVLIEGSRIVAVEPDLAAAASDGQAIVVDAEDAIVIPGFQDTHRHCWQSQLRRLIAGDSFAGYLEKIHTASGPVYTPEDIYAGDFIAALGALDAGVTTVLDFSHNSRSSAHSDAAIQAFVDVGVRAVHGSGAPLVGEWDRQWPHDMERLRERWCAPGGLVTLRMAVYGAADIGGPELALSAETIRYARAMGIEIIADAVMGPAPSDNVEQLGRAGLLGPDVTLIHCTDLSDEAWRHIAEAGVKVSLCPTSDPQVGLAGGIPPIQRVLDHGVEAGLSVDVECCLSTSMFAQMQGIYTIQRMLATNRAFHEEPGAPASMTVRDVLELATRGGAAVNGLAGVSGTLAPGKEADLVLLGAQDVNTMPLNNAIGTVVLGADTRNVDTVLVGGDVRKWRGQLLGHDLRAVRRLVSESRDRVVAASGNALDVLR